MEPKTVFQLNLVDQDVKAIDAAEHRDAVKESKTHHTLFYDRMIFHHKI
jgi:hypothetical protein